MRSRHLLLRNISAKILFTVAGGLLTHSFAVAASYEVESDPVAYILKGFSFHGTLVLPTSRLDVGAFGMTVPKFLGQNELFTHEMIGVSVNWDYFGGSLSGLFGGLGIAITRNQITHDVGEQRTTQTQLLIGPRIGFRIGGENQGFFVSPWIGVYHVIGSRDVVVGGDHFRTPGIQVFPTIHIGFRF